MTRKPPMPFIWHMATNCLEMPYGTIRHFPAGSYYAQTERWTGEAELELMKVAHSAWYTFKHTSRNDWKPADVALFNSLRRKPEPRPTRRWETIVSLVHPLSAWVRRNMNTIRYGRRRKRYY